MTGFVLTLTHDAAVITTDSLVVRGDFAMLPISKLFPIATLPAVVAVAAAATVGAILGPGGFAAASFLQSAGAIGAAVGVGLVGDLTVNARRPPRRPGAF